MGPEGACTMTCISPIPTKGNSQNSELPALPSRTKAQCLPLGARPDATLRWKRPLQGWMPLSPILWR